MEQYKKTIVYINLSLMILSLYLCITTESKMFSLYKEAYLLNMFLFGVVFFWMFVSFKIVPTSEFSMKIYARFILSFLIFVAPILDLIFGRVFKIGSVILLVLAISQGFYFVFSILLYSKKRLDTPKVKELLSEIFSNQKSN
ncbi:hypothetical protein AB7Y04_17145 [Providencia rettgeri]|uniref:hypothetical protein n=1 Tax=Providencia TaxID=586 RepID=UPI000D90BFA3|nr:hypothetical protein [Providencia rettgeri]PYZ51484.1 hypothetical protein DNK63_23305 [Providencia rettgeri]